MAMAKNWRCDGMQVPASEEVLAAKPAKTHTDDDCVTLLVLFEYNLKLYHLSCQNHQTDAGNDKIGLTAGC
jgi:hypothetical protein